MNLENPVDRYYMARITVPCLEALRVKLNDIYEEWWTKPDADYSNGGIDACIECLDAVGVMINKIKQGEIGDDKN